MEPWVIVCAISWRASFWKKVRRKLSVKCQSQEENSMTLSMMASLMSISNLSHFWFLIFVEFFCSRISEWRCEEIVREIITLFHTEREYRWVYYNSKKKISGSKSTGKLKAHHSHVIRVMKGEGLLEKEKKEPQVRSCQCAACRYN